MADKRNLREKLTNILFLVVAAVILLPPEQVQAAQTKETVRVGFFAFDGYHNQDEDGNRSGYGYEYLQQMARYTGWTYEYVGYEGSWSDAQKMLENGEIDLLTSAQKTEAREKKFDFSDNPIGYSSTIFTIKAGNEKYTIDDFESFDGIDVGMLEGNSRNAEFAQFAQEKGFDYEPVMFDSTDELVDALQAEKIDAIVTSSLRVTDGEWVVSEFGFSPYYVCVKKGNQELLDQVNAAIGQINQNNPGLQNELNDKYYSVDSGNQIAFTEEERRYIASRQEKGEALTVMINPDRAPMSYYQNGSMQGIFGEIATKILENSGLPYEIVEEPSREVYETAKREHTVDICMDMRMDYNKAEELAYRITDSYYSANVSRVTRNNFSGEVKSIAAIRNSDMASKLEKQIYQDEEIVYYETGDECVEAVKKGYQDAVYLYTYVAEKYMSEDITHKLSASLVPDFSTDFCLGIGDTTDTILFSILNKSVASVGQLWKDNVTMSYTGETQKTRSLLELLYDHPVVVISTLVVLLLLLTAVCLMFYRQPSRKKEEVRAKELQRMFRYVCREHEKVMEVNLETMTATEYYLKDEEVVVEEKPFKTEGNFGGFMYPSDYQNIADNLTEEKFENLISNGKEYVFEARGKEEDGSYKWYIYTIYGIVPDTLHPHNFMLFKHDVNEIKEKEEHNKKVLTDALEMAKEASSAKGNFMSRMSHEIRTPLNAVIGYMDIARDSGDNPEKMMHCVENSDLAAKHLLSIINDVLDISSIESGRMKIAHEEFDLKKQITTLSTIFFHQAKEKQVNFEVILKEVTQEWVVGDSLRVNQILMNLLSNAVKFTPVGGNINLTVKQAGADDKKVYMSFSVSDTGIGMSEEYQKRLFQPFEQESATTAQKYGGTGLGLSITYNLIQMMGGTIEVHSRQNEGTTFEVSLYFEKSKKAGEHEQQIQDYSHVRVLIVDDDEANCEYMQGLFERCKVKSDVVTSGEAAVRQIKRRLGSDYMYDMCLMDWNMPGMNGIETARKIREECKSDLPIIIATAYDVTEFEDEAKAAGIQKVIAKPLFQSTMFDLLVATYGKYESVPEEKKNYESIKGLRILLAEDNAMNMEIAVEILTKAGLVVDPVMDGQQAFDKFTQSPEDSYDAILMDVQMPVMDGYQATAAIRKSSHPQAKTISIIAMTANAFAEDVNAALASGMNGHVSKPVDYEKLYRALNEVAAKKRI